jgi:hypothetical protein
MEFMILSYNRSRNEVFLVDKGSIKEDIGARQDKLLYALDVNYEFVLVSAYKNVFKVIYLKRSKYSDFRIRYDYDEGLFLCPIFCSEKSQFGLVKVINNYTNEQKNIYLNVFEINTAKMEIGKDLYSHDLSSNPCISLIMSPKFGGIVIFYNIIGTKLVEKDTKTYTDRRFLTYTEIDRTRYIY